MTDFTPGPPPPPPHPGKRSWDTLVEEVQKQLAEIKMHTLGRPASFVQSRVVTKTQLIETERVIYQFGLGWVFAIVLVILALWTAEASDRKKYPYSMGAAIACHIGGPTFCPTKPPTN